MIKRLEYLKIFGVDWKSQDIRPEIYPSLDDFERAKAELKKFSIHPEVDRIVSFDITSPRKERQPSC